jgi:hypothetical protein
LLADMSTALSYVYDCRHRPLFHSCLQTRGISHDYPAARHVFIVFIDTKKWLIALIT